VAQYRPDIAVGWVKQFWPSSGTVWLTHYVQAAVTARGSKVLTAVVITENSPGADSSRGPPNRGTKISFTVTYGG
jgi:hypothetical protein